MQDDLGTIEVGKLAGLLVFDDDPVADISAAGPWQSRRHHQGGEFVELRLTPAKPSAKAA